MDNLPSDTLFFILHRKKKLVRKSSSGHDPFFDLAIHICELESSLAHIKDQKTSVFRGDALNGIILKIESVHARVRFSIENKMIVLSIWHWKQTDSIFHHGKEWFDKIRNWESRRFFEKKTHAESSFQYRNWMVLDHDSLARNLFGRLQEVSWALRM